MGLKSKALFILSLLAALLNVGISTAAAEPCKQAKSPNNLIESAEEIKGEFCRIGSITADGRDYYYLELGADEVSSRWTFELQVLPGQLGRFELFYLPSAERLNALTAVQAHVTIETSASNGAVSSMPLVLRSGKYLLAVSGSQAGVIYKLNARTEEVLAAAFTKVVDVFETAITSESQKTELPWQITGSGGVWQLKFNTLPESINSLSLVDEQNREIAKLRHFDTDGSGTLSDLSLTAGSYKIIVQTRTGARFLLQSRHLGAVDNYAYAIEPDNDLEQAHMLQPGQKKSGRLIPSNWLDDLDYFKLEIDQALSKKQLEIILRSGSESEIRGQLLNQAGDVIASAKGLHLVRLSGLVFDPGSYYFKVLGTLGPDETYTVELSSAAALQNGVEREPNDQPGFATLVSADELTSGSLSENDNRDFIKVKVETGLELWDFEVIGDSVMTLALIDSAGGVLAKANPSSGSSITRLPHVLVPKGMRTLSIAGRPGNWLFRARRIGPPKPGDELEPNDDIARAAALYPDVPARGWLDHAGDIDFYSFYLPSESRVRLALSSPADFPVNATLEWGQKLSAVAQFSNEEKVGDAQQVAWEETLPPGDYYLSLRLKNAFQPTDYPYTLKLESRSALKEASPGSTALDATLLFQSETAAAFIAEGQQLEGTLQLKSDSAQILKTQYWAADERWNLSGLPGEITLERGVELKLPLTLQIAPDSRDDWPMLVDVELTDAMGGIHKASSLVELKIGAVALNPYNTSVIPPELRGGINLAWSNLGAQAEPPLLGLIDGIVDATSVALPIGTPVLITLAAKEPLLTVGAILTPPPVSAPESRMAQFKLELSEDGANFIEVVSARLSPEPREQAFVFDRPVKARFARLYALSNYSQNQTGTAALAELKVIQEPSLPFDKEQGLDLADPIMGGHIVYTSPPSENSPTGESALWLIFPPNRKEAVKLVFGFMANRMASIKELTWQTEASTPATLMIPEFEVSASTAGPLGPWKPLGTWKLDAKAGELNHFRFNEPIFARSLLISPKAPNEKRLVVSGQLKVLEEMASESYRSILGEWGEGSSAANFKGDLAPQIQFPPVGHTKSEATALTAEISVDGIVKLGETENWYKLTLPAAALGIVIQLSGNPTPEVAIDFLDATGQTVPLAADPEEPGTFSAPAHAGEYFIRISQPPRSVIVAWDTSGSVTAFQKGIQRIVERLVWDLEPEREAINLVPFRGVGSYPILEKFSSSPDEIYAALADYPWNDDSSNAEAALLSASKALAPRAGLHAIAIITDAASDGASLSTEMWQSFKTSQPRIFALKIPITGGAERSQAQMNLMQDWSNLNGGFYTAFSSQGVADLQFRRMAARLRQPAMYSISYAASTTPPKPGELVITAAKERSERSRASVVEILFDASGSMLQRIGNESKINIAKKLLADLVSSDLSQESQLAIRVFGQGGRGSCSSDLVFPVSRLEPAKVKGVIAKLQAVDGAKTAIATSLHAISSDLANHAGKKLVVLITDGEETCGGDPRAEIELLKSAGFDIRINIVGFSVESEEVRKLFKAWAELGRGEFFDAQDSGTLQTALRKAILPQFEIVDHEGKTAGRITPGPEPVSLAPGKYTLRFADEPDKIVGEVEILAGKRTEFQVSD